MCGSELRDKKHMSKTKTERTLTGTARPEAFKKKAGLDEALIEQWLAEHYEQPEDILGKAGLLARLTKAVVERALGARCRSRCHGTGRAHSRRA